MVCSGNICRSPMAAEYLRHRAQSAGLDGLDVRSAGTLGIHDVPASPEAVATLREAGLDLSKHRSRGLGEDDLADSDVVICMSRDHQETLADEYRSGPGECWLLRSFEAGAEPDLHAPDLPDPIGEPIEFYREQFQIVRRCVEHLVVYLARRTGAEDS